MCERSLLPCRSAPLFSSLLSSSLLTVLRVAFLNVTSLASKVPTGDGRRRAACLVSSVGRAGRGRQRKNRGLNGAPLLKLRGDGKFHAMKSWELGCLCLPAPSLPPSLPSPLPLPPLPLLSLIPSLVNSWRWRLRWLHLSWGLVE